eukprot:m.310543 g.310543  ORF g.310543 m.310543 type:complete len:1493 (+) comp52446_c0_seq1:108-4586(+)
MESDESETWEMEVEMLASMFPGQDEFFQYEDEGRPACRIRPQGLSSWLQVIFPEDYPLKPADINVNGRDFGDSWAQLLNDEARRLAGSPMAIELIQMFQELAKKSIPDAESLPGKKTDKKAENQKKAKTKKKKEIEDDGLWTGKKKPMKQATDVISRILWDPDLPSEQFCIGYLDRFVGIIEKPFSAFSWEDLASVDQTVLAIPKHRIQYFKYRDIIVWDKRTQIDNMFGSRGAGQTISDVMEEYQHKHPGTDVQADVPDEDGGESDSRHANSSRPTHFICIPVTNPHVLAEARSLQETLCSTDPRLSDGCLSPSTLHLTLAMLRINSEKEMETVKQIMDSLQFQLVSLFSPEKELHLEGVQHFRDRVIHTLPLDEPVLHQFAGLLMQKLSIASIATPGNYAQFNPHVTLIKLSRPMCRQYKMTTIERGVYQAFTEKTFGRQKVECIHLCSVTALKGDDGPVYVRCHTVRNCFTDLSPAIPRIMLSACEKAVDSQAKIHQLKDGLESDSVEKVWETCRLIVDIVESFATKSLVLLRGLPGSGKSTVAKSLRSDSKAEICSADDYRYSSQGYAFNQSRLVDVHRQCFLKCIELVGQGCPMVIIDNTNSHLWEYAVYERLGHVCGYQVKVVEIACPDQAMVGRFAGRNVHSVSIDVSMKMWKGWEPDTKAILVDQSQTHDEEILHKLLVDSEPRPSDVILYTALFINPKSRSALLSHIEPSHETISANHVTFQYRPHPDDVKLSTIGSESSVRVVGVANDGKVQAALVEPEGDAMTTFPHITISTQPGTKPRQAKEMLSNRTKPLHPVGNGDLILRGIVGAAVGPGQGRSSRILTNPQLLAPILNQQAQGEEMWPQRSDLPIHQLFIFDFDHTLFDPPGPVQGRHDYERLTGRKWPHHGFLSHPESLLPPLNCLPGPALAAFFSHCGRAGSLTVVLTARLCRVEGAVWSVLDDFGVFADRLVTKDDSGETACEYKVKAIQELITEFPHLRNISLWDDADANLVGFRRLARETSSIHFEITDAKKMANHLKSSQIQGVLSKRGILPDSAFRKATQSAVRFISNAWQKVLKINLKNPLSLALEFGSSPLGRKSDCDVCLLAPDHMSHKDCVVQLEAALKERGLDFTYVAHSSRCPRLKVQCFFTRSSPVELDIVFTLLPAAILKASPSLDAVIKSVTKGDRASQTALTGPEFLRQLTGLLRGSDLKGEGAVCLTDMLCCYLKARCLKGNAFHCIRTFHVLKLLVKFLQAGKLPSEQSVDTLFIDFMRYCSGIDKSGWVHLFGEFVPQEYIPDIQSAISLGLETLQGDGVTAASLEELLQPVRVSSLMKIDIKFNSTDYVHNWKMAIFTEARLGTYIRRLLAEGLQVYPSSALPSRVSFRIADNEMNVKKVQYCLKGFWDEMLAFSSNVRDLSLSVEAYMPSNQSKRVLFYHGNVGGLRQLTHAFISASDCVCLVFPPTIGARERQQVHEMAEELNNVKHYSQGEGKERCLTLQKHL